MTTETSMGLVIEEIDRLPKAFTEQSCTIAKTGSQVTIYCDEADEANELFDWLNEGVWDQSKEIARLREALESKP